MSTPNLSAFHFNTVGLPDSSLLDTNGNVDPSILKKKLGIDRQTRRITESILEKNFRKKPPTRIMGERNVLLDGLCNHGFRVSAFYKTLKRCVDRKYPAIPHRGSYPTWEGQVLQEYWPGFHLTPSEGDWQDFFAGLLEEDIYSSSGEKLRACNQYRNLIYPRIYPAWVRFLEELVRWDECDDDRRRLLADVAFAFFSLLGVKALEKAVSIAPGLLDHYQFIRSFPANQRKDPVEPEAEAQSHIFGPLPVTLKEFYAGLREWVERGLQNPYDLEIARKIDAMVKDHLPELLRRPHLGEEEQAMLAERFIQDVLAVAGTLGIKDAADPDCRAAMAGAWRAHLDERLRKPMDRDFLIRTMSELHGKRAALSQELEVRRRQRQILLDRIADLETQQREAKFGSRRRIEHALSESSADYIRINQELIDQGTAALEAFLPAGTTYDELESQPINNRFAVAEFDPSVVRALISWRDQEDNEVPMGDGDQEVDRLEPGPAQTLTTGELPLAKAEDQPREIIGAPDTTGTEPLAKAEPKIRPAPNPVDGPVAAVTAPSVALEEVADEALVEGTHFAREGNAGAVPEHPEGPTMEEGGAADSTAQTGSATPPYSLALGDTVMEEMASPPQVAVVEGPLPAAPGDAPTKELLHVAFQPRIDDAVLQFRKAYTRHSSRDLAVAIENIAFHWMHQGHLNAAHATLRSAGHMDAQIDSLLGPELLKATYFGMNVWSREAEALVTSQRLLNQIQVQQVEDWCKRKPGGKAVPYLIFAATFQPALFGAKFTQAPMLLGFYADLFPPSGQKLIRSVLNQSHQNTFISLDLLRKLPIIDEKTAKARLMGRLSDWRDRIVNKQTGWAPVRKALTDCLDRPDFARVISAIEGESEDREAVAEFIAKYTDTLAIVDLFEEQVKKVQSSDNLRGRNAKTWFIGNVIDLCGIANDWLVEYRVHHGSSEDLGELSAKLVKQMRGMQEEISQQVDGNVTFDQRVCMKIAAQCLVNFRQAIENPSSFMVWGARRAEAWFSLPYDIMAMEGIQTDGTSELMWLAERVQDGLDTRQLTQSAMQNQNFRLAKLMLLERQERGEDVEELSAAWQKQRGERLIRFEERCNTLQTLVGDAQLSSLVDEEQGYLMSSELEHIKEDIQRRAGDDFDRIEEVQDSLDEIERGLDIRYREKMEILEKEFQDQERQLRVALGDDAISDDWLALLRRAIQTRSLSVAEELIDQLKTAVKNGTRILDNPAWGNSHFKAFLELDARLYEQVRDQCDPRLFPRKLVQEGLLDLDFKQKQTPLKGVAEILVNWRSNTPKTFDQAMFRDLWEILRFLGFHSPGAAHEHAEYRKLGKQAQFEHFTVETALADVGRPFPVFGTQHDDPQLALVLALRDWQAGQLKSYLDEQHLGSLKILLISTMPMSPEARNHLAKHCKENQYTVFHVDLGMLIFLATLPDLGSNNPALRNFLMVSAPWTYYNPYVGGDFRKPPRPEMRYGRQNEIHRLTAMQGGSAIIYGGRQMGKSTILHETLRIFNQPKQQQYAFYHPMDQDIPRIVGVDRREWESARDRVWGLIYRDLEACGLVKQNPALDVGGITAAVTAELQKEGPSRILVIFDEIDPLLALDSVHNFGIFRGLSALVSQPNGRFKLIIAGLENVKRFEDSPNFPLPQLGSSLQVSILPTLEALQLVREPLEMLGYEFEDDLVANRVLSATNRHPGLIQIFCHELLKSLALSHKGPVGSRKITSQDIARVGSNKDVRDLIRSRFNMTLYLDKRYLVIVYSLILAGRASTSFTSSQAKEAAQYWVPGAFKKLTEKQFEAFLSELVGLGVLRVKQSQSQGRDEFALRNTNILNLVGVRQDIEHELMAVMDAIDTDDPLMRHAFDMDRFFPSPLTFRDEKQIIGLDQVPEETRKLHPEKLPLFSITLVTGSKALGIDKLETALPSLYDFDPSGAGNNRIGDQGKEYQLQKHKDSDQALTANLFGDRIRTWITRYGQTKPGMHLVEISGSRPISHTLDLLDMAHKLSAEAQAQLAQPLRLIFVFQPRGLWLWESRRELTLDRAALQSHVSLDRWSKSALAQLLYNLGMNNTPTEVDRLRAIGHGWYFSLAILCDKQKKKPVHDLSNVKTYIPLTEVEPTELRKFLKKTGLEDVSWGIPFSVELLKTMETFDLDTFDLDVLGIVIESEDLGLTPADAPAVLNWLLQLKIVEPVVKRRNSDSPEREIEYQFEECIRKALTTLNDEVQLA